MENNKYETYFSDWRCHGTNCHHCEWCNEPLTVSNGVWDKQGNHIVECHNCGYQNTIKIRRF